MEKKLPFFEYRPSQLEMSKLVLQAASRGNHLLVEAGTGTGKTLAYLIPAVISNRKVVVSTGTKTLQDQLMRKDIPLVRDLIKPNLSFTYLKGRANYICRRRLELFNQQPTFFEKEEIKHYQRILDWVNTTESGEKSELEGLPENFPTWKEICSTSESCIGSSKCHCSGNCFVNKARRKAAKANIVVVNHHLYFADISIRGLSETNLLPEHQVVVFDEAHQLEDIATDFFSITVSNYSFTDLIGDIRRDIKNSNKDCQDLLNAVSGVEMGSRSFFECFSGIENRVRIKDDRYTSLAYTPMMNLLNQVQLMEEELSVLDDSDIYDRLRNRARELAAAINLIMSRSDPSYVYWMEPLTRGTRLGASPINIAMAFKAEVLDRIMTVILTSATLATQGNFDFVKSRLGVQEAVAAILPSSFDFKSQALLFVPQDIPEPRNDEYLSRAIELIEKIIKLTDGRALVLFTSYHNMNRAYNELKNKLPFRLLLQGQKQKGELLEQFRDDVSSVLFATSSFWQGIDVQGESLGCVIIDKLPFAVPSEPIVEARIEQINQQGKSAFYEYQIPQAVILLKQGMGRLLRSAKDTGILCLLDSRVLTKGYGRMFLNSLPDCPLVTDFGTLEKEYRGLSAAIEDR